MATNELPPVTVEDLLRMIGDKEVTIARQATVIASQAARLAEGAGGTRGYARGGGGDVTCQRCGDRESIPGHRMRWCEVCEAWRLAMLEKF